MKTEIELNEKILRITNKIRKGHPEFLKYLNEMPITVPYEENPEITVKNLKNYYDSLVVLFKDYKDNASEGDMPELVESLPVAQIKTMELDNSYQNLMVEVNNYSIFYNDVGEGNIPILFLHGFPFDKSMWEVQLDNLKSVNRVIALDIRGFGKSINENMPLSIDLFTDDIIGFMDKLKIEKAVICGLSMGGYIALNCIKKFPERFGALILCDTQCNADTTEAKENRYKTIEQINNEGTAGFNDKFIASIFHPDSMIHKMDTVENLRKTVAANSKEIIAKGLAALAERSESCSSLDAIRVPTLIICGKQDQVTPVAQSEFMHRSIKGSILKIIDSAGHVSNLEQPDEFNKYILDFLNSIGSDKRI